MRLKTYLSYKYFRSYLRLCLENMSVQRVEYIKQWIRGFEEIRRNSPQYTVGDIRNFYSRKGEV